MFKFVVLQCKTPKIWNGTRNYALAGPPRVPPGTCGCPPLVPGAGRRIVPPPDCGPGGPVPLNPCCPTFHHGEDTYNKYKYIFMFLMFPLIVIQYFRVCSLEIPEKGSCRDYEYMRRRIKRFPWGDGTKSLFHNDHTNSLPSECEPPPLDDCD